jgi:eukaryotic-like serine/threonine-protein kinase
MIPAHENRSTESRKVDALLAFDRALVAGDATPDDEAIPSLLAVHGCQRLLEAVWPRSAPYTPELPRQFGRFSIVRELGRGGFGVVFLAEDSVLGRQVALKVPRPEVLVTPDVRRRFVREAEAASRLDHPHIVPVYEVGEEGPICYIASAYCDGPTLADWLRGQSGTVPFRVASRLVAMLAAGVAHAHERGILHRDLKPGNILLQQPDGDRAASARSNRDLGLSPRICDFGLAKLLDQVSQETRTGVPIGSPDYMAPEQATGRLREHGPATDIYALGVILYELLTGRPPHRGESDLETLRLVSDLDPASPRALRPSLPRDLETITLKCLEKRPDRRYSDASALVGDLERFLEGQPVLARPVSPWERAVKWARRRPVHAALALFLGIIVTAVPIGLQWSRMRDRQHALALRAALERSRLNEADALAQRSLAERQSSLAYEHLVAQKLKLAGVLSERGETEHALSILDSFGPPQNRREPRGFAWSYLDRLLRGRGRPVPALPDASHAIAYRPDGRMIAIADHGTNVYLMDLDTGAVKQLPGKSTLTECDQLVFSPDGRFLASLTFSKFNRAKTQVMAWDLPRGALVEGMSGDLGLCYQVMFSPDSRTLVTVEAVLSNRAKPIRSWRLPEDGKHITLVESLSGRELHDRLGVKERRAYEGGRPFRLSDKIAVTDVMSAPDKTLITFAGITRESGEIELYDSRSGFRYAICRVVGPEVVFVPRTEINTPYEPAKLDVIGRAAMAVSGCKRARPLRAGDANYRARFSFDGSALAVLQKFQDRKWKLRLLDVATERTGIESTWDGLPDFTEFAFAPGGDALFVVYLDASPHVWNFDGWRIPGALSGHKKEVWGLAFSADGKTLVSSSDDATIKLWDFTSGTERKTLKGHESLVTAVAYSPDGLLLASAGWDRTVRLWSAEDGAALDTLSGHGDHVRTLAFSADGKTLASAGDDKTVRVWDVSARHALGPPLVGHTSTVFAVAFAPDGKILYSGAGDKTIRRWDVAKGRSLEHWPAEARVTALKFAPDGQTLAAAKGDGSVTLWDVAQARPRLDLRGHHGDVLGIAFCPDGSTLASAGRDKTVRIWDLKNGHEQLTLNGHQAPVHGIAFSPDGTVLATGSYDGAIEFWRASPDSERHDATQRPPAEPAADLQEMLSSRSPRIRTRPGTD